MVSKGFPNVVTSGQQYMLHLSSMTIRVGDSRMTSLIGYIEVKIGG